MKHCILAKWNETVTDKAALLAQVRALYTAADDIPGVHSVTVHPCCIDRPNRYNLMIHHRWKDEYGGLLEQKAIFDYE